MRWMAEMSRRDNRIVDANIMTSLQNGTAFFASTSLLAIGASATLLRASDDAVKIAADLPFGIAATRVLFEVKVIGLLLIFGYAFFKFAWAIACSITRRCWLGRRQRPVRQTLKNAR